MISNLRHVVCCIKKSNFQPKYSIGVVPLAFIAPLWDLLLFQTCLHGGGGPQVSEVTRLGGVTRLSI